MKVSGNYLVLGAVILVAGLAIVGAMLFVGPAEQTTIIGPTTGPAPHIPSADLSLSSVGTSPMAEAVPASNILVANVDYNTTDGDFTLMGTETTYSYAVAAYTVKIPAQLSAAEVDATITINTQSGLDAADVNRPLVSYTALKVYYVTMTDGAGATVTPIWAANVGTIGLSYAEGTTSQTINVNATIRQASGAGWAALGVTYDTIELYQMAFGTELTKVATASLRIVDATA